jgi:hypothetical protein
MGVNLQKCATLRQGFSGRFRGNRNKTVSISKLIILCPFVRNDQNVLIRSQELLSKLFFVNIKWVSQHPLIIGVYNKMPVCVSGSLPCFPGGQTSSFVINLCCLLGCSRLTYYEC